VDAAEVGFVFNLIDRLADSFKFHVPSTDEFSKAGKMLLKRGYRM
jgi:hypothetical protein